MDEQRKIRQINDIKDEYEGVPIHRLVVMVGAADFFGKKSGQLRKDPYELFALLQFLQSIGANKDEERATLVLCFDSNYTEDTIKNDIHYANYKVFLKRGSSKVEGFVNDFIKDKDNNPDDYIHENWFGNVLFKYFRFDLVTSQPKFQNAKEIYNLMDKPLTKLSDECKPKEKTAFEALEQLCKEIPFEEYYLYNCAWIRGFMGFQNEATGKNLVTTQKQNRHFENMCEFLYIFQHLNKSAYLLTAEDMLAYTHLQQKQVGSLYITPLNSTTTFKKENWTRKKGGKSRKQKRSKKRSQSRKWRKV